MSKRKPWQKLLQPRIQLDSGNNQGRKEDHRPKCPAAMADQMGRQRRVALQASREKSIGEEQIPMCLKEEGD